MTVFITAAVIFGLILSHVLILAYGYHVGRESTAAALVLFMKNLRKSGISVETMLAAAKMGKQGGADASDII
jgi:hypothetical protein